MKIIVAGSRSFNDYRLLEVVLNVCIFFTKETIIISGSCESGVLTFTRSDGTKVYGADGLGERYGKEKGIPVEYFPADWNKYGKSAGPIRNEEMAKYADGCIVFWDGKSKGSADMIKKAKKNKLILYEEIISDNLKIESAL